MKQSIVILGDGLLGKELHKQTKWPIVSRKTHKDMDFTDETSYLRFLNSYDIIVNCIAHTDTYSKEKEVHWNTNYKAVSRLCDYCNDNNKKLVHISTDYVYANCSTTPSETDVPVHQETWYSYTKLLGDSYIELKDKDYLIIRCSHKQKPFPYKVAYANVSGSFDYVDVIANQIKILIERECNGIYNIGTKSKSLFMLAQQTVDDVLAGISPINMPTALEMKLEKLNKKINEKTN